MTTRVETQYGTIEGQQRGRHIAFRGLPFARPPVGALRFGAPQPPEPWSGVRQCSAFGPMAIQGTPFALGVDADGAQSEDCLSLNVFTQGVGARKRPVLFWIHGGAYKVGAASLPLYDGGPLTELGDVVVVSHNYRLGAFGFLYLGDAGERIGALPNVGILDSIAALSWVRSNIERFGGDPGNVTIFGESAGATSVSALLIAPKARGLFQRAICQSTALRPTLGGHDAAERATAQILSKLGIASSEVERLRDVPAEELQRAQREVEAEGTGWRTFFPVRHAASLPQEPRLALADPQRPPVPLIVGSNRDEFNLFDAVNISSWAKPMERSELIERVLRVLGDASEPQAVHMVEVYARTRARLGLPHDERTLLRAILGDLSFRIPGVRLAEAQARARVPVYMYLFTYESPAMRGALRACHALDLPFVFGTYSQPAQARFVGTGRAVEALSDTMMRTWISFAEQGTPTFLPDWQPYTESRRATMLFEAQPTLAPDPLGEERAAWNGII